jgi:hypothetical protein
VIGAPGYGGPFLRYWKFERLEIKNGSDQGGSWGAGFWGEGGPFWFRYCYIHDNIRRKTTEPGVESPAGLKGHVWNECIVEYCLFKNNFVDTPQFPGMHIAVYSDYAHRETPIYGFSDTTGAGHRNVFRYNLFVGGSCGFKYKGSQVYTGNNPAQGRGWDDTYKTYGDQFHHNIFQDISQFGIGAHQDFIQVYKNIFDNCTMPLLVQYQPGIPVYKAVVFNNTMINCEDPIVRYGNDYVSRELGVAGSSNEYFGWDINNVFSRTRGVPLTLFRYANCSIDATKYCFENNYIQAPAATFAYIYSLGTLSLSQFATQTFTAPVRRLFDQPESLTDPLFESAMGPQRYVTRATHTLGGGVTIATGGRNSAHPYLEDLSFPAYVGATNPDDHAWVAGVLGLGDVSNLVAGASGDPLWVERAVSLPPVGRYPAQPGRLRLR